MLSSASRMDITHEGPASFRTSAARQGPIALLREGAQEIYSRHHLIRYLARADMKKKGADTFFGNVWWILDPLLQMVVYVVLVTLIFQKSVPDYPLFIFAAILPWKWFTTSVSDGTTSVSGQDRLIKQLQFPKLVLPLAAMVSAIGQFAFGLIPLGAMLILLYPDRISPMVVWIPVIAAVQFVFILGIGLLLSATNVFFRDVGNLTRPLMRLWFYLSPALYGADTVANLANHHPTIAKLMHLNPFYTILTAYRDVIYYGTLPDFRGLAIVLAVGAAGFVVALWFFKRLEPAFAKVL
jgi:lipopolysaccharide transport system permease protein